MFKYEQFSPELDKRGRRGVGGGGHDRNTKIEIEQNDKNQMKADPHKSNGQIFHHYIISLLLFWLLSFAKIMIKCATTTTKNDW